MRIGTRYHSRGQSAVEFFLVAPLFFGSLLACISASLWSIESEASVSLAEQAARVAVSGIGSGTAAHAENLPSGAAQAVLNNVIDRVKAGFFDTNVIAWKQSGTGSCNGPNGNLTVTVSGKTVGYPPVVHGLGGSESTLALCIYQVNQNVGATSKSLAIHVFVVGYVTDFVPPIGLGAKWGEIAIDVGVVSQSLLFST